MTIRSRLYGVFNRIGKRGRIALSTGLLTVVFFGLTFFPYTTALFFIPILIIIAYITTLIAILDNISGIEWIQLFIVPVYIAVLGLLFYYLLPVRLLTRIPFSVMFFVLSYAALLSENIFNIGVDRSLPLYRAAYSVMNFIILILFMLVFNILYSFGLPFYLNILFGSLLAFPLFFHGLWSSSPMAVLEERIWKYSAILTILLGFGILLVGFLPLKNNVYVIATVGMAYFLMGITQEIIQDTAFHERIRQYIVMYAILVFFIALSMQL